MAEAHDEFFGGDKFENALLRLVGRGETLDQLHGRFVRASMQGTAQRADRAGHGRIEVRQGGDDGARGKGRGVKLVLGVKDERNINGAPVELVRFLPVQQMEEVTRAAILVGLCVDSFAAQVKVMPVEKDRAKARED